MSEIAELFAPAPSSAGLLAYVAQRFLEAKGAREQISADLRRAKEAEEALELALLERMTAEQVDSVALKSGERVSTVKRTHFTMPPLGDVATRAKAVAWLREVGLGDLIREDVNGQSLGASLREYEAERGAVPEGIFRRYDETTISVRKK